MGCDLRQENPSEKTDCQIHITRLVSPASNCSHIFLATLAGIITATAVTAKSDKD
jgi:hypothetical protein